MRRFSNYRRGVTMMEVIVYISVSAVLVSLTAQWFHLLLRTAGKNKQHQRQHVSLKKLAWEFRNDVWESKEFSLNDSGTALSLTKATEDPITYRIKDGQILKTVGDAKSPAQQEIWRDLKDLKIEFQVSDDSNRVSLNLFRSIDIRSPKPNKGSKANEAVKATASQTAVATKNKPILQISSSPAAKTEEEQ